MSKLFYALSLWIDEVRLHDPGLYLPALPEHYEPNLLARIFNKQTQMWLEYLDAHRIQYNLNSVVSSVEQLEISKVLKKTTTTAVPSPRTAKPNLDDDPALFFLQIDRLMERMPNVTELNLRFQSPLVEKYGEVVEKFLDIDHSTGGSSSNSSSKRVFNANSSKTAEMQLVVNISEHLLRTVFKYNKEFINHSLNCMTKLDEKLCGKLLTNLWCNEVCEKYVQVPCTSLLNPMHQCTRPAMVKFVYELATKRDQYREEIKENRYSHDKLMSNFFDVTVSSTSASNEVTYEVKNKFPHDDIVRSMVALNQLVKKLLKNNFNIGQQLEKSNDQVNLVCLI